MDHHYELNGLSFVWSQDKARLNVRKHGISFEQACTVFFDPFVRLMDASRSEEVRDAAVGLDEMRRLLYVVHIEMAEEAIRMISARRATREESAFYDS